MSKRTYRKFESIPELIAGIRVLRKAIAAGFSSSTKSGEVSSTLDWIHRRNIKPSSALLNPDTDIPYWGWVLKQNTAPTGIRNRKGYTFYNVIRERLFSLPGFDPSTGELKAEAGKSSSTTTATSAPTTPTTPDHEVFHATVPATHTLMVRLYQEQPDEFVETVLELVPAHVIANKLVEFFAQAQQEITTLATKLNEALEYTTLLEKEVEELKLTAITDKAPLPDSGISFLRKLRGGSKVG